MEGLVASSDSEIYLLHSHDFERAVAILEEGRAALGDERVAQLEWALLPALGYEPSVPTLHGYLATSPAFFVEVVSAVYRPAVDDDDPESASEVSTTRPDVAVNGHHLLSSWQAAPGRIADGIDGEALRAWIEPVRDLLTQQRRLEVGLTIVGQVLAFAPVDSDGIWPSVAVRDLIEELADENLDEGVVIGLFNRRGATVRNPAAGGTQETSLAQTYLEGSESLADRWPRTAAMLRTVADGYDRDARRQEERAERFRRGHRLA